MISFTNTLSGLKEEFIPIDPNRVRMYVCGPTVYDRAHLGNARSAVVYDVLFRTLKAIFPNVVYTRNITDVDDKIIAQSKATGRPIFDITTEMTRCYHEDLAALNCLTPTHEPKATQHIRQMIIIIQSLIERGFAYEVSGHVLFSVEKFSEYGKLSNRSWEDMVAGARVEVAPFKQNPADFVLWKPCKDGEEEASFESPWGLGRPGWHIECSAMSQEYLGHTFDIHGGGADLIFPHHENEIAQSVCSHDHTSYAKFWIHNGFLTVDGEKMSKSLGNFHTVHDVLNSGVQGNVLRYLYLTTHYRKPLDYNDKAISDSKKAVMRFTNAISGYVDEDVISKKALEFLSDDLSTSLVISYMHDLASDITKGDESKKEELLGCANLIGLDLSVREDVIPDFISGLAEERREARNKKDWPKSDLIRKKIYDAGYGIDDKEGNNYSIFKL
jgi:cysteinyl-tRNA synthetase